MNKSVELELELDSENSIAKKILNALSDFQL